MGTLASGLRNIAAELAAAPRVYVDANVPLPVVAAMRHELGWDVLFVLEHDELRRAADARHFELAREFGRTLITLDHDFFDDRAFPPQDSPGVVVCTAPDAARLMRMLVDLDRFVLRAGGAGSTPLRGQKLDLTPDTRLGDD